MMAMTCVTFDQTRADALVHEIGQAILADAHYAEREWSGIALVIKVGQRKRMYGYVYSADGEWEAETPDDFDVIDRARDLAEVMAEGGSRWTDASSRFPAPAPGSIYASTSTTAPTGW
jgi:hypothetical protein